MSQPRPYNDEEVQSEMNKMVAFISQEAREKAREIQVKADEEFAIEKAKIVRQESQSIDALYEKKRKQAETGQKIAQSTALNTSRLKILRAREQLLADLFETTRKGIKDLGEDEGKYEQLIVKLIVQGLLLILSPAVAVIARPKDKAVVERAATAAIDEYKSISGQTCEVTVSDETLSDDSAGGVKLVGEGNRITVNNTIDERLGLLEDKMLPEIRADLFGLNENRKFYN